MQNLDGLDWSDFDASRRPSQTFAYDAFVSFQKDGAAPIFEDLSDERVLALYRHLALRAAQEEFTETSAEYSLMLLILTNIQQRQLTVLESDEEAQFTRQTSPVVSEIQRGLNLQATGQHEMALQVLHDAEKLVSDLKIGVSAAKDADILLFKDMIATAQGTSFKDCHDLSRAMDYHDLALDLAVERSALLANETT
ncbi:MAG: hypothetical protein WBV62_17585, partial [Roseobacter sp.]